MSANLIQEGSQLQGRTGGPGLLASWVRPGPHLPGHRVLLLQILALLFCLAWCGSAIGQTRLGAGSASGSTRAIRPAEGPTSGSRGVALPPGLERLSEPGGGAPIVLVPGIFLSARVFQHGPEGGLARVLERSGFDVWAWTPWGGSASQISSLSMEAGVVAATIQRRTGKPVRWVGMEHGALLGLYAASDGAPLAGVAALAPRLELSPCFTPYERALSAVKSGDNGTLTSLASSLWSRGDVANESLEQVLVEDMVSVSPALASSLLDACGGSSTRGWSGLAWERLWLPVAFFVSSRDGQAPIELVLEHADAAATEFRMLKILSGPQAPSHLGLLLGAQAPGQVYQPLTRWLKTLKSDERSWTPMVPEDLRSAPRRGERR